MFMTKVGLLNWYSLTKKKWIDSDNFWRRKMTLNVRILQLSGSNNFDQKCFKAIFVISGVLDSVWKVFIKFQGRATWSVPRVYFKSIEKLIFDLEMQPFWLLFGVAIFFVSHNKDLPRRSQTLLFLSLSRNLS